MPFLHEYKINAATAAAENDGDVVEDGWKIEVVCIAMIFIVIMSIPFKRLS
ncbi:hypothetical protein DPMN_180932 [Dreissena polymorpha]|uniref:Uncharacterized protein n=1 Tax=Dreissena polymorpha TaxID=45954 RepID=A0A9D4DF88_DREPO|nr:hypothetical protein DPMN_180932 [Dreissena polymorpha]